MYRKGIFSRILAFSDIVLLLKACSRISSIGHSLEIGLLTIIRLEPRPLHLQPQHLMTEFKYEDAKSSIWSNEEGRFIEWWDAWHYYLIYVQTRKYWQKLLSAENTGTYLNSQWFINLLSESCDYQDPEWECHHLGMDTVFHIGYIGCLQQRLEKTFTSVVLNMQVRVWRCEAKMVSYIRIVLIQMS